MLDPRTWLHHAKTLDVGKKDHFDHDCGGGRTLVCGHKKTGWDAYCYRCGDNGWVPHPAESLAAKAKRLNAAKEAENDAINSLYLPHPMVGEPTEWPDEARVWLYRAGLDDAAIKEAGFYWSPRLERVVMPVITGGVLSYWQARGFNPDRPKYINPTVDKSRVVARYGDAGRFPLCFTEDILSAWKVGRVTQAWCLLGTALPQKLLPELLERSDRRVLVWLDPDNAGRRAMHKIITQLHAYGMEPIRITSEKDPKLLSKREIERIIRAAI